jgi:hypothetical protein
VRGVGALRPKDLRGGRNYADPLAGVEENLAYNAFLVGQSLLGMRVGDVLAAVKELVAPPMQRRIVLCGRRDAALVACLAAVLEPKIHGAAVQEMPLSYFPLFSPQGTPINAASILPNFLRSFGDLPEVLALISPRKLLLAATSGPRPAGLSGATFHTETFTQKPALILDWLAGA